ncbi:multiple sugar transport system permease protein [Motilibacter peucedani]|uniref:Multiple sugar transport system permease protein n=1 Tax=Motilibacter peucedani TaxID=598650 RepID=A0A420XMZ5_9ACTN|nr:carbohydrate ABC transporter permease [Motilibacter peucedani]RKS72647.1 multiple sugar transport system permease protein [Motilibacter peucedani]
MTTTTRTPPVPATEAPRRPRRGTSRGTVLFYAVLLLFAVLYIYPFVIQLGTAFKTNVDSTAHPLNPWPSHWSTAAFRQLADADFPRWFANSVFVTLCVTAGRVFFDSLAGYALARLHFFGRDMLFDAVLAVMAVPGVVLLIPKFLVLNQLGMYNSYSGMIVPLLVDAAGVFIMRQFFLSVPLSVEEAARVDGASTFRTFWSVVLPMARPALITLTILSFQGSWNELPHFIVSRQDPKLNTLTTGVASLVTGQYGSGNQYPLKLAAALLMTIPVALVFFTFQRHFTRGGTEGAVKG